MNNTRDPAIRTPMQIALGAVTFVANHNERSHKDDKPDRTDEAIALLRRTIDALIDANK